MKYDLSYSQIDTPLNRYCSSGHIAPEEFEDKPIRFFEVNSKEICGKYCELCLIIANDMAKRK